MNYQKHYDFLISRGQSRILEDYSEKHHIIPRCLGGDNSKDNLVRLTPEEHYLAHQLLVKINPGNHKLVYAANMMVVKRPGNKLYGWLRRKFSEIRTGRTKANDDSVCRMSEKLSGRTKDTHEYLRIRSENMSGRTKDTHEHLKRSSEKRAGRSKDTHKYLKHSSEKQVGRTKETHPGVKAMSEKKAGRTKDTHDDIRRMSEKLKKLTSEQEHLLYKMRIDGISGKEVHKYFALKGVNLGYSSISAIFNRIKYNII